MKPLGALLAIVAAVALGLTYDAERACEEARAQLFAAAAERTAPPQAAIATAVDRCRGTTGRLAAAGALHAHGDRARAVRLAREAAAAEPESEAAWRAVAATASGQERRSAQERWARLDPLGHARATR